MMNIKNASRFIRSMDAMTLNLIQLINSLVLSAMFVIVFGAIVARYIFNSPPFWSEELSRYLMFYLVLLGMPVAYRLDIHPRLTSFATSLPYRLGLILSLAVDVGVIAMAAIFIWAGSDMAIDEAIMLSPSLRISFFWVYLALPIGGVLLVVQVLARRLNGDAETHYEH